MSNINLIVARSSNNVIGNPDGDIPWHLPNDFKWFKEHTLGSTIIMGRKTFDSIGRFLPNRQNVILTRDPQKLLNDPKFKEQFDNLSEGTSVLVTEDIVSCMNNHRDSMENIFIIGGGFVYRWAMRYLDIKRVYITEVDVTVDVHEDNTTFEFDSTNYNEFFNEHHGVDEKHKHAYTFRVFEKI